ncbi:hypothetical protein GOP47_0027186 [Adiantum capillus-veneris]|nr:hypothetical protein GOP47_0027186 [Adiantum capillus-veneris]
MASKRRFLCDMDETTRRQRSKKLVTKCQQPAISIHNQDLYSLEFDGASKGNPGKSGAGAILKNPDGTVLCQLTKGVGVATCNFAEYRALIMGLQEALDRGIRRIKAQGDSKLVCCQVMGRWKVNSPNLSASFSEAMKLKERFQSFSIQHVYREFNSAADFLANTGIGLPVDKPQIHCSTSPYCKETPKTNKVSKVVRAMQSSYSGPDVSARPAELSSLSQERKEVYRLNFHGASNGKYAGAGVVLYSPDGSLHLKLDQGLGIATRNVAQYQALVIGLQAALECNASHIQIQGDALLVFKQMIGTIKVRDEKLQALWKEANSLLNSFTDFSITHVVKSKNSVACGLAEEALSPPECRSTTNMEGTSNVVGCETLKILTYTAEDMTFTKMARPLETSIRSLCKAVCCPRAPTLSSGLFAPTYSHQASRVSRVRAPLLLAKCLPLYAANTSIHKIVLQCASKRARIIPHIFQSSFTHIQAAGAMYKPSSSTSAFQICLNRIF